MNIVTLFLDYIIKILPALILLAGMFFFFRKNSRIRILLYLALFVVLRDVMTPLKLWSLGTESFFWIRLHPDALFLVLFGIFSLIIMGSMILLDTENRKYIHFFKHNKIIGIFVGSAGCIVVILPLFMFYQFTDISLRGGAVPAALVFPILIFALFGNFFEEGLFRGYVLGFLEEKHKPLTAGILSGIVFAACHVFLATTVTSIGYPLLVFTLWEGIIAGIIGARYGLLSATLTHGGAIFLLASGLI